MRQGYAARLCVSLGGAGMRRSPCLVVPCYRREYRALSWRFWWVRQASNLRPVVYESVPILGLKYFCQRPWLLVKKLNSSNSSVKSLPKKSTSASFNPLTS